MRHKWLTGMLAGLLVTQMGLADPAVYRDNTLSIPGGAVINEDSMAWYRNVELSKDSEGNFRVTAAERAQLAGVDTVQTSRAESTSRVDVQVEGTTSTPCVNLEDPAISRRGETFTVVLAETESTTDFCTQVLSPFETTIPVNVDDLPPGDYTVNVNGVEAAFSLPDE